MPWKLPVFALGRAISTQLYAQRSTLVARSFRWRRFVYGEPGFDLAGCQEFVFRLVIAISRGANRVFAPHSELVALGMPLSASSVWNVVQRYGIEPAPRRASVSWREFLRQQTAAILECDFFTVETLWLRRFYVLFFIELSRRRVHLAGVTSNPDGAWVVQQARNLTMTLAEQKQRHRFLIRDRDSKFTAAFDEVFRSEGLRLIKAPIAAPRAKAHAERWVGSIRRECLDRVLIVSRRQLETVLREYVAHYNTHRPHRSLEQQPPLVRTAPIPAAHDEWRVRRRDRLGGLLHEYELAA
jgi:putative transposase